MNIKDDILYITLIDLDHILDIDLLKANRDISPSELFIRGLEEELHLNALDILDIKSVQIKM